MDAEGLFGVEKVEPDSLNLLVNTSVGSSMIKCKTYPPCLRGGFFFFLQTFHPSLLFQNKEVYA